MNTAAIVMSLCYKNETKTVYGAKGVVLIDDTTFCDKNGNKYLNINETNDNGIAFLIDADILRNLYGINDVNDILEKYFLDMSKYLLIKDEDDIKFLYVGTGENKLLEKDEWVTHFMSQALDNDDFNINKVYDTLKSKVYCQDEAIKKITTALYLHYSDIDQKQKTNIIIDGDKATGKTTIINALQEVMPVDVLVEDLGDPNFSFDLLFLGLYNKTDMSACPILVLDNADKILLNRDIHYADETKSTIKKIMLGMDYKLQTPQGTINYPTKDFVTILMGDFKKRGLCGIDNYVEGVPEELSVLTNYNIKLNSLSREMVYQKLLNEENGTLSHYEKYLNEMGVTLNVREKIIDKIVDMVLETNMHELDKIVEKCFEELIFEICTSQDYYKEVSISTKTLNNNKKYLLK